MGVIAAIVERRVGLGVIAGSMVETGMEETGMEVIGMGEAGVVISKGIMIREGDSRVMVIEEGIGEGEEVGLGEIVAGSEKME